MLLKDGATGVVTTLPVAPRTPRAWHTATVLADGSVLILGGVDTTGNVVGAPERFVPSTRSFEPVFDVGFAPRARHTATTLTDGRVLIVGGAAGNSPDDVEIWDPLTRTVAIAPSTTATLRRGHRARLLNDGTVLIVDGSAGVAFPTSPEVFDPASNMFRDATSPVVESPTFYVAGTNVDSRQRVPLDARFSVWFSQEADVRSLNAYAIQLLSNDGPVPVALIPAEGGRLIFLTPRDPLRHGTTYRLSLNRAVSTTGATLVPFTMAFTTEDTTKDRSRPDSDDVWSPDMIVGRGWRANRTPSPWQSLPPLQAPPGVTALAGQALLLDGRPLPDVTLSIDGQSTRTDGTGRFLLTLQDAVSGRHELEIDGTTANRAGRTYGFFEAGLPISVGRTNILPYTLWMPRIDTAHRVSIPSPTTKSVVVTTPRIPGLELHLPPQTVIRDHDGRVVRELTITPIPVDRPPFPLPDSFEVPLYFTIQPGGAYVYTPAGSGARGARLVYPNYQGAPNGTVASFWHYDPEERGWYVYGTGAVKGRQVIPNPGVAIYEFTGAMINTTGLTPPPSGPPPGGSLRAGDPVDLPTGLFVHEKLDLFLPDAVPLALRRTYRPNDSAVRPFGIGTTHDYAMFLWSAAQYQEADLILPDGGRIHYVRTSPGTGFVDAEFEHTSTPTEFYKSRITYNDVAGGGWNLRLRDGTVYVFGDNAPLQSMRDRFGNTVTLTWSSGTPGVTGKGNILRVDSQNGRWIAFTYDASNRVTQARDNIGRTVGYEYDASGRLWRVTDPAGGVTEYTYDASHRMLTIRDARGICT